MTLTTCHTEYPIPFSSVLWFSVGCGAFISSRRSPASPFTYSGQALVFLLEVFLCWLFSDRIEHGAPSTFSGIHAPCCPTTPSRAQLVVPKRCSDEVDQQTCRRPKCHFRNAPPDSVPPELADSHLNDKLASTVA
mmetsp:Transcript_43217/g.113709  ORF Transcript_43217/g.113709 Transcript_43217/m.113709 type:complete len:135 (-) Transcript_43217:120-524(-)